MNAVGIPVYENTAVRLQKDGHAFWIAGLGDQWAFRTNGDEQRDEEILAPGSSHTGVDDLPAIDAAYHGRRAGHSDGA